MNHDRDPLLTLTDSGLYCEPGDFFIDPWRPVDRAIITHAHADHLAWGCEQYLVARDGLAVARARLGETATIATLPFGESIDRNGVKVSLTRPGTSGLLDAIDATNAEAVWLTHGYTAVVARWLGDHGREAHAVATRYEGESERERAETPAAEATDRSAAPGVGESNGDRGDA